MAYHWPLLLQRRIRTLGVKLEGLGTLWSLYRDQNKIHRRIVDAAAKGTTPLNNLPKPFRTIIPNAAAIAEAAEADRSPKSFTAKYSPRLRQALSFLVRRDRSEDPMAGDPGKHGAGGWNWSAALISRILARPAAPGGSSHVPASPHRRCRSCASPSSDRPASTNGRGRDHRVILDRTTSGRPGQAAPRHQGSDARSAAVFRALGHRTTTLGSRRPDRRPHRASWFDGDPGMPPSPGRDVLGADARLEGRHSGLVSRKNRRVSACLHCCALV
jgi:hypothetical protein